jgi:hypothetical protein
VRTSLMRMKRRRNTFARQGGSCSTGKQDHMVSVMAWWICLYVLHLQFCPPMRSCRFQVLKLCLNLKSVV